MRRRPQNRKVTRDELDPLVIPYLEAYPVIAIKALKREWTAHRFICEWISNHIVIGEMTVSSLTEDRLTVIYSSGANTDKRSTTATFRLNAGKKRNGANDLRIYCPGCNTAVDRLFLRTARWACQPCHGLTVKRKHYGYRERLIEQREKLISGVHANPRPSRPAMWLTVKAGELVEINRELDETGGPFMDETYSHKVTCWWYRDHADREGLSELRPIPAYLDARMPLRRTVAKPKPAFGRPGGRSKARMAHTKATQPKRLIAPYLPPDD